MSYSYKKDPAWTVWVIVIIVLLLASALWMFASVRACMRDLHLSWLTCWNLIDLGG